MKSLRARGCVLEPQLCSLALLKHLGFTPTSTDEAARYTDANDERVMSKAANSTSPRRT